jgi:asparagine synthase (glutamine-hydrolysing)
MCGIAGIISTNPIHLSTDRLKVMTDTIAHRGPDGEGFWINKNNNVGLGHRRLAIIDLSDAAAQPFHYLNRYSITYNGEIYNYIEVREELQKKGYRFQTQSDTEVILAAYDCWKDECVLQFDGMFAFAIWDQQSQKLFAARDRFGEKPFYYFFDGNQFLFASEIKALWAAGIAKEWNHLMLLNYLANGHTQNAVDASLTFYKNIYSIPPGHHLIYSLQNKAMTVAIYWDLDKQSTQKINEEDAIEQFQFLFNQSIKRRLRSDVPTGTSLSGGLDSSSVVATIHQHKQPTYSQSAFTAVFPGFEKDELAYAKKVSDAFQLHHYTTEPTAEGFLKDYKKLLWHQEQPLSSSSVYAQYKVIELAKENAVTVLLDGQGADEILAGYNKYVHWYLQEQFAKFRYGFTMQERIQLQQNNIPFHWGFANYMAAWFPIVANAQLEEIERKKILVHPHVRRDYAKEYFDPHYSVYKPPVSKLNDILYFNTMQQGLGELLHNADRNSMAHSREMRLPFLNHELVEFVFSLPSHYKIHNGFTKYILRKSMEKKLPKEIVWRTDKVGYEPPQKQWMRQPAMNELIIESRQKLVDEKILNENILDKPIIAKTAYEADNYDWRYFCVANLY